MSQAIYLGLMPLRQGTARRTTGLPHNRFSLTVAFPKTEPNPVRSGSSEEEVVLAQPDMIWRNRLGKTSRGSSSSALTTMPETAASVEFFAHLAQ